MSEFAGDLAILRTAGRNEQRVVEHDVLVEDHRLKFLRARPYDSDLVALNEQPGTILEPHRAPTFQCGELEIML